MRGNLIGVVSIVLIAFVSFASGQTGAPAVQEKAGAVETKAAADTVRLKVDTVFAYVAVEMTGSYDQHSAAIEKLYNEAMKQEIYGGMPFGVYFNSPGSTPVEQLKWDVGFTVPAGTAPKEPLTLKKWEYTTMASVTYEGPFGEAMGKVYQGLYQWIGTHAYVPAGPMMEKFLSIPTTDDKGEMSGQVEIDVPVKKAQ